MSEEDANARPGLKTWRFLLAAEAAVEAAMTAAEGEGLQHLVQRPMHECRLYLTAALANVEALT